MGACAETTVESAKRGEAGGKNARELLSVVIYTAL